MGSHTLIHPNVAHVAPDQAELFPCFNEKTTEVCRRAGYATAVTTKGVAPPQDVHEFRWKVVYALIFA